MLPCIAIQDFAIQGLPSDHAVQHRWPPLHAALVLVVPRVFHALRFPCISCAGGAILKRPCMIVIRSLEEMLYMVSLLSGTSQPASTSDEETLHEESVNPDVVETCVRTSHPHGLNCGVTSERQRPTLHGLPDKEYAPSQCLQRCLNGPSPRPLNFSRNWSTIEQRSPCRRSPISPRMSSTTTDSPRNRSKVLQSSVPSA